MINLVNIYNSEDYIDFLKSISINKRILNPVPLELVSRVVNYNSSNIINLLLLNKYVSSNLLDTITHLQINGDKINDKHLNQLPNLRYLKLKNKNSITDDGIKNLTKLKYLDLNENNQITNDGIKHLTKLKYLSIDKNKNITDDGIKNLINIETLILTHNYKPIMDNIIITNEITSEIRNFNEWNIDNDLVITLKAENPVEGSFFIMMVYKDESLKKTAWLYYDVQIRKIKEEKKKSNKKKKNKK